MITPDDLANGIRAGVEALRRQDPAAAVDHLMPLASDRALVRHTDLQDVRSRVCSLLAQALLECGRTDEADQWATTALRILRMHPDLEGQQQVRDLQTRIRSTQQPGSPRGSADRKRVHATSAAALIEGVADGADRSQLLVEKAASELDAGRNQSAEGIARRAVEEAIGAQDVRGQVLGWLTVARSSPAAAHDAVFSAWRIADSANDFTLVATVARAAQLHGIVLRREETDD